MRTIARQANKRASMRKNWCMTWNNYPEDWEAKLTACTWISYWMGGKERGNQNTPHIQGYFQLTRKMRMASIQTKFQAANILLSIRSANGTVAQNRIYCSKENPLHEHGTPVEKGQRSDILKLVESVEKGMDYGEVIEKYPSLIIRYSKGVNVIYQHHKQKKIPNYRNVAVTLHVGPTGCGKTRSALFGSKVSTVALKDTFLIHGEGKLKWFDGYKGQKRLVIDEYSNDCKITTLLKMLDGYKWQYEIKGGFVWGGWTEVYITSNLKVEEIHSNARPAHRLSLFRRITTIVDDWNVAAQAIVISD